MVALPWHEVIFNRTNGQWRELLDLAQLLLGERFQTTSAGSNDGFSLLFEMHTLFEEYVARMFKRALAETDLNVISQGGRVYCLETADRRGIFQTRPDILIKRGDTVVQVIDTKWKRIGTRIEDPKHGVSQGDIYQMLAYGQLYQCPRLTLLYPHSQALGDEDGPISQYRVTSTGYRFEIASDRP